MGQFENISYNSEFHAQKQSSVNLTHFYVWCKPALSFLWDIEHSLQSGKLTVYVRYIYIYMSNLPLLR